MAGSYPALEVSFAPGVSSSAVPTGGQWVDATGYVRSLDVKYGREDEFSQPSAGSLELELDNASGRFDPDNSTGPYFGQLVPLVWFRVRGGAGSVAGDVFYGQVSIEGWRLSASQFSGAMLVKVTVVDMFEQLANTDLPESVWALKVAGSAPLLWWRLGESSGTVAVDSSGNERHGTYEGGATFNSRSGLVGYSADNAVVLAGSTGTGDPVFVTRNENPVAGTGDFTVAWWMQHQYDQSAELQPRPIAYGGNDTLGYWRVWSRSGDSGLGFMTGNDAGLTLVSYTTGINDGEPHLVVFRRKAGTLSILVDGALVASAGGSTHSLAAGPTLLGLGDPLALLGGLPGAVYDEFMMWGSAVDDATVAGLYAAGTIPWEGQRTDERVNSILDAVGFPATLRTVATGNSTLQPTALAADTLSALQDAVKAEGGILYVDHRDGGKVRFRNRRAAWTDTRSVTSEAAYGDSGAEIPYTAVDVTDDKIINDVTVQRANGARVTTRDAVSVTQYQRRSYSETGLLFRTDDESRYRAQMIVAEKKDRHRRARSVTLEPARATHPAWAEVFARQIGDRVTVKWRPPYGGVYSFPSIVEGIAHSWRPSDTNPWRTTLYLSPVPYGASAEPYFIIGVSEISGPSRIGY